MIFGSQVAIKSEPIDGLFQYSYVARLKYIHLMMLLSKSPFNFSKVRALIVVVFHTFSTFERRNLLYKNILQEDNPLSGKGHPLMRRTAVIIFFLFKYYFFIHLVIPIV